MTFRLVFLLLLVCDIAACAATANASHHRPTTPRERAYRQLNAEDFAEDDAPYEDDDQ